MYKYYKAIVQFNHNEELIKIYGPNLPKEPTQVILCINRGIHWIWLKDNKHLNWEDINTSTLGHRLFTIIMLGKEIKEIDIDA